MTSSFIPPPATEIELLKRARILEGKSLQDIGALLGLTLPETPSWGKGRIGEMVERALGATAGNRDVPDFQQLGIELKTVPLDKAGRVQESTYVCYLDLRSAGDREWESSRVHRKLSRVLFIPVLYKKNLPWARRYFGTPLLWSPSSEEEALLRSDWNEIMGRIAVGGIDEITAHMGQALQVRPKARNSAARTQVFGDDGALLATLPRGFYLRARFTESILWAHSK